MINFTREERNLTQSEVRAQVAHEALNFTHPVGLLVVRLPLVEENAGNGTRLLRFEGTTDDPFVARLPMVVGRQNVTVPRHVFEKEVNRSAVHATGHEPDTVVVR